MGKRIITLVATASFLTMTFSGCSAIMYGLGSLADASKPDSVYVPGCPIDTLKLGTFIQVITSEDDTISGKYQGTNSQSQYESWETEYHGTYEDQVTDSVQVSAILIRTGKSTLEFPVDNIESILWYPKKNSKYVGLVFGACIDALIIYVIATIEINPLQGGGTPQYGGS